MLPYVAIKLGFNLFEETTDTTWRAVLCSLNIASVKYLKQKLETDSEMSDTMDVVNG